MKYMVGKNYKTSSFNDYLKEEWAKMTLLEKIQNRFITFEIKLGEFLHKTLKIGSCFEWGCVIGRVGAKNHYCVVCKRKVFNENWKEERETLKNQKEEKE